MLLGVAIGVVCVVINGNVSLQPNSTMDLGHHEPTEETFLSWLERWGNVILREYNVDKTKFFSEFVEAFKTKVS